jgi:carbon storage regulator CsrA
VWIGGSICVEVLEVGGGRVKLGFSAPPDVDIHRDDIRAASAGRAEPWCECPVAGELCALVS